MTAIMHPSVPLGTSQAWTDGDAGFAERIRVILETRPGMLPWRPDFGCDLDRLVGQPATPQRINEARWRVEQAIRRWLPEVKLNQCVVSLVRVHEGSGAVRFRDVPIAEAALLSLGTQAALEIHLDVETPEGPLSVQATLEP